MFEHMLSRVYFQAHVIRPDKLEAIRRVVTDRALGIHADAATLEGFRAAAAERRASSVQRSVAVMPILGTLFKRGWMLEESSGMASTDAIGREFDRLVSDESVGAIVLDIDSPGGEVFGVPELADKIAAARGTKPIVASANAEAASGAYWLASAADEITITPSGWVGSVGVVMVHTDLSQLNETMGAKVSYIHAGQYKVEGNSNEPLSDESRAYYQQQVDAVYERFVSAVAKGRGVSPNAVKANYGQGRMLMAKDAKAAGMVDRIETLDETIARLAGAKKPGRGPKANLQEMAMRLSLHGK